MNFRVGDRVLCIVNGSYIAEGKHYTITGVHPDGIGVQVSNVMWWYRASYFKKQEGIFLIKINL